MDNNRSPLLLLSAFSLFIALYGVLVLGWSTGAIIALFWYETLLLAAFSLGRILLALNGKKIWEDVFLRFFLLFMGGLGMALIAFFIVMLSAGSVSKMQGTFSIADPSFGLQRNLLLIAYVTAFLGGFLLNGAFKQAAPVAEFVRGMGRMMIVLIFILLSGSLGGNYFQNATPIGVTIAILLAKFFGEYATANIKVVDNVSKKGTS